MKTTKSRPAKRREPIQPARRPGLTETSRRLLLYAALLVITLAAYYPVWHGGFLWDDDGHVTKPTLQSLHGLWRIWFDVGATQQYYPVAHSAFWLMHRIWGDDTLGYHLVNIVLHASSAFLVALILRRLAVRGAFIAALIFAVHPVGVESVAWITELKNTLSGVLYLGALLTYLEFDARRRWGSYGLALALFALALFSKTVTATLPAALLVIFWWQRGCVRWREDVLPLSPFFASGIGAGLLTAWLERTQIGAEGADFQFTLVERCLIAGRAVWFYLMKLVWPTDLMFVYPRWRIDAHVWWQYLFPLGVVLLAGALWAVRARSRAPLAALLFFAGTLVPALGFVNVYPFLFSFVADHFQYLASLGIIALVSSGIALALERRRAGAAATAVTVLLIAAPLTAATWRQSASYVDAETLYPATIDRNPSAWMAYTNLGRLLQASARAAAGPDADAASPGGISRRRLLAEAAAQFQTALRVKADLPQAHNNLGAVFFDLGQLDEAKAEYEQALRLKPTDDDVHYNLGLVLEKMGRSDEAIVHLRESLRIRPGQSAAESSLGDALLSAGRLDEAITAYREALRLNPADPEAHHNLGAALGRAGQTEDAVKEFEETLRLNPQSENAISSLAIALARLGRSAEAVERFREAVRLAPQSADAHAALADALDATTKHDEAIEEYRQAVHLRPNFPDAFNGMGVAAAELGRYADAAAAFREALRLNPQFADARANLARALAAIR